MNIYRLFQDCVIFFLFKGLRQCLVFGKGIQGNVLSCYILKEFLVIEFYGLLERLLVQELGNLGFDFGFFLICYVILGKLLNFFRFLLFYVENER